MLLYVYIVLYNSLVGFPKYLFYRTNVLVNQLKPKYMQKSSYATISFALLVSIIICWLSYLKIKIENTTPIIILIGLLNLILITSASEATKLQTNVMQRKISNVLGVIALLFSFGALFIFAIIGQTMLPFWITDIFAQIVILAGILSIMILPKNADHTISISVIFAIIAAILYFGHRL